MAFAQASNAFRDAATDEIRKTAEARIQELQTKQEDEHRKWQQELDETRKLAASVLERVKIQTPSSQSESLMSENAEQNDKIMPERTSSRKWRRRLRAASWRQSEEQDELQHKCNQQFLEKQKQQINNLQKQLDEAKTAAETRAASRASTSAKSRRGNSPELRARLEQLQQQLQTAKDAAASRATSRASTVVPPPHTDSLESRPQIRTNQTRPKEKINVLVTELPSGGVELRAILLDPVSPEVTLNLAYIQPEPEKQVERQNERRGFRRE